MKKKIDVMMGVELDLEDEKYPKGIALREVNKGGRLQIEEEDLLSCKWIDYKGKSYIQAATKLGSVWLIDPTDTSKHPSIVCGRADEKGDYISSTLTSPCKEHQRIYGKKRRYDLRESWEKKS